MNFNRLFAGDETPDASGGDFTDRLRGMLGGGRSGQQGLVDDLRSAFQGDPEPVGSGVSKFFSGIGGSLDRSTRGLRTAVGLREEQEPTLLGEIDQATSMSYTTRFYAFCISLSLGLGCSILSWLFYFNDGAFAVIYTFGNLLSLSSSAFFWGPKTYGKMMFKKTRLFATLAMISMMAITLFTVFYVRRPIPALADVALLQFISINFFLCLFR